jgi:pyruvate dehydrogenase E1 component
MLELLDPLGTHEWRDALSSVLEFEGADRAGYLFAELIAEAPSQRRPGAVLGKHPLSEHDPGQAK